jgi:hypothetical protein
MLGILLAKQGKFKLLVKLLLISVILLLAGGALMSIS